MECHSWLIGSIGIAGDFIEEGDACFACAGEEPVEGVGGHDEALVIAEGLRGALDDARSFFGVHL